MKKLLTGIAAGLYIFGVTGISDAYMLVSQGLDTSAYTASSSWANYTPDLAFDGSFNNMWNAGNDPGLDYYDVLSRKWYYAYPWIEVDLGQRRDVTRIVLGVEQYPEEQKRTTHQIWTSLSSIGERTSGATVYSAVGSSISDATLSYLVSGMTVDGQILTLDFPTPVTAQYIQIRSIYSPSWIAWNEIQIMTRDELPIVQVASPAPEPASMILFSAGMAGLIGYRARKRQPEE